MAGGRENRTGGDYSFTVGYRDTIGSSGDYSVLLGIDSDLNEDSTFMVDMPHIRFGDTTDGYEFPTEDGATGQVMATDGNGMLTWTTVFGVGDNRWTLIDSVLYTNNYWGLARGGVNNALLGNDAFQHVNWGIPRVSWKKWKFLVFFSMMLMTVSRI